MVPKMYEPLKFDCSIEDAQETLALKQRFVIQFHNVHMAARLGLYPLNTDIYI